MDSENVKCNNSSGLPPEIEKAAKDVANELLPDKSRDRYEGAYHKFIELQKSIKTDLLTENVLLAYFKKLSEDYQPSTLWSQFSMLKAVIKNKSKVNIGSYSLLSAFLKKNCKGYSSTKSKVLEAKHVEKFLNEAPDNQWLAAKVILVIGITGGCRGGELPNIKCSDIEDKESIMIIRIPDMKNNVPRTFVIEEKFMEIVKKYMALRPKNVPTDRFFLNYINGKCTKQVIGKNKFANTPKEIAQYLGLPDARHYTGHCFRRTSATLLANQGANSRMLQQHGGWKSSAVAEGYVENSVNNKRKIGNLITQDINLLPLNSHSETKT